MIVNIASFEETGPQLDEGIRHVREEVVPSIRGSAGLRGAYWMVNREGGKRLSVTIWDSASDADAAMPAVLAAIKRRRAEAGQAEAQRAPDRSERFEVFAQL